MRWHSTVKRFAGSSNNEDVPMNLSGSAKKSYNGALTTYGDAVTSAGHRGSRLIH
jgi:hypothetical protein